MGVSRTSEVAKRADARVAAVVIRHGRTLFRVARQASLCDDDADDAVQRGLEIFVRRVDTVEPATEVAWLKVVIRNEALAIRRARSEALVTEDLELDDFVPAVERSVEEQIVSSERVRRSAEALRALKPDEAAALMMKAHGLSYEEIGERQGWSYTKVNRAITEGRRRFLAAYEGIESGGECERYAPVLEALSAGSATSAQVLSIRPHLRHCGVCRATVRELHLSRLRRASLLWPALFLREPPSIEDLLELDLERPDGRGTVVQPSRARPGADRPADDAQARARRVAAPPPSLRRGDRSPARDVGRRWSSGDARRRARALPQRSRDRGRLRGHRSHQRPARAVRAGATGEAIDQARGRSRQSPRHAGADPHTPPAERDDGLRTGGRARTDTPPRATAQRLRRIRARHQGPIAGHDPDQPRERPDHPGGRVRDRPGHLHPGSPASPTRARTGTRHRRRRVRPMRSRPMTLPRRLALMLVLILIAGAGAAPALAGEYPVYACEPTVGDVNASWEAYSSDPALPVYTNCPPAGALDAWNRGLVTRAAMVHGSVPANAHARLTFRAPAGAGLSRMTYDHAFCGGASFQAGLMNDAFQWLHWSPPGHCGTPVASPHSISLGGTPAVHLMTWCATSRCTLSTNAPTAYAAMRSATVWVTDSTTPSIAVTGGSATSPGWKSGVVDLAFSASDNVGIQTGDVVRGNDVLWQRTGVCNPTLIVQCPPLAAHVSVDTRSGPDGPQRVSVRALDSAHNWGSETTVVLTDNTAPGPPLDVVVAGGSGWRSRNAFDVTWRNPSQGAMSPVVAMETAICPAANTAEQWTACTYGQSNATGTSRVQVPADGEWVGRFWLRDAAGNASRATAQTVELRLDSTAPEIAFQPIDESDPTRIDVVAMDAVSPIAAVEIEVRLRGSGSWTPLQATRTAGGFSARLDDEQLSDGLYDLRARVADSAGNERSTEREPSRQAVRKVPTRIDTRLVAGHVRLVGAHRSRGRTRRRIVVVRPTVSYGRTLPIDGRLTMPGGNPVPDGVIEVWEQPEVSGAEMRRIAVIGTDERGRFKFNARRGPSRILRFRYPGTALVRARTTEVEVNVKAGVTIAASRRRVVNGEDVVLSGRLTSMPSPASGKLLQLQAYSRGGWLTFATPRADPETGRWSHRYRFTSTRGTVRYRFRARVPGEATYPYSAGVSGSVYVKVRGL